MRYFELVPPLLGVVLLAGCAREAAYYLERGNRLAAGGEHSRASIEFRKAIQQDPELGEAYLRLGLTELELEKGVEGMAALQRAVTLMPESGEAKARLADLALAVYQSNPGNQAMYNLLTDLADQLLAADSNSFDGFRIRGDLALFGGQLEEALGFLGRANAVRPNEKYVILPYVEALVKVGRLAEAKEFAQGYIAKDPTAPELYDLLYLYHSSAQRLEDALSILELKAENNPNNTDARISLAAHHLRAGEEATTRAILLELTSAPERFEDAFLKAGSFLMNVQDWDAAVEVLEQGTRADPERGSEYLRLIGTVRLAQGRQQEGRELIEKAIEADPQNTDARFSHASLLLLEGGQEAALQAVEEFKSLLGARPKDAVLRLNLSKAYLAMNEADKAREMLVEAARLNARDLESRLLLAGLTLELNMPAEALHYTEELLTLSPDNPGARLARAQALGALQRYDEAQAELDRLERHFPEAREIQIQQGLLAIQRGQYASAERTLSGVAETSTRDLRALAGLAQIYGAQNQLDRAFSLVDQRLAESPDSPALRRLHASTALRSQRVDVAVSDYERLVSDYPDSPEALVSLGNAYRRQARFDEALARCSGALELNAESLSANLCVALTLQQLGRADEAIQAYRRILSRAPDHAIAANNLAYLLAESQANLEEATEIAQAVVERQPSYVDAQDTLGYLYLKRGMADSALQIFQKLVRDHPNHPSYKHHLGAALAARKDFAEARAALEAALQSSPSTEEEAEIRRLLKRLGS